MTKSLLIVSADTTFIEVLLHGLEQEGYSVHVTKGKGDSVVRADEANVSLAFLDMDLGYRAVVEIGQALRMLRPDLRLIVFPVMKFHLLMNFAPGCYPASRTFYQKS
jgi:ActR/RegA family two-component response regulator